MIFFEKLGPGHCDLDLRPTDPILGYPGVIPLATSTPGTISRISFDLPLNEYYHFISFILIFNKQYDQWKQFTYESGYLIGPHTIKLRIDFGQQIQSFSS